MHRSLALAAIGALACSAVLAGAPAVFAAPGTPVTSPVPAVSAGASGARQVQLDQAVPDAVRPGLRVEGLPNEITAGGQPTTFSVELTNRSAGDLVFYPAVKVNDQAGKLDNTTLLLDYQKSRQDWAESTIPTFMNDVRLLGPVDGTGVPAPSALIFVKAGKSVSIKVRLGLPDGSPTGPAFAQFIAYWLPVDAAPDQPGVLSASTPSYFCVLPPGDGHPTGSPSASSSAATGSPSPSGSPSGSSTGSPSSSASAGGGTPSASHSSPSSSSAASSASSSSASGNTVTPFPVQSPQAAAVPIAAAGVQQAKAVEAADEKSLAFTGGGGDATPIAVAGASVLAAGVGTLVLLRRRRGGARHA
ncbi:hypothetical protein [Kitasatospora sp. GAS204B]|uniref:hypothetical protein n=1 Tax=unclassified Kitasatospora TaxID=2633591 RepID=UPI0024738D7D|nr:hypothetical protein [Kitasatospora sp. GAS204B]MDH6119451.1 hypothetical protein [Kitasatospora sp. GAS204B]